MKSKINWRYINILILLLIVYMIFILSPLWGNIFDKTLTALLPIILAFSIAFIFNPMVSYLNKKLHIPRVIAILFLYAFIISFVLFIVFILVKPAIDDLGNLSVGLVELLRQFGDIFNVDTTSVQIQANSFLENVYSDIANFFTASGGSASIVLVTILHGAVVVIVGIIFLINFESIKLKAKEYLNLRESKQLYHYVAALYHDLTNYLISELIIAGIQFLEYSTLFFLIGMFIPEYWAYAFVLGVSVAAFSLVPYFGGYISTFFMILIALSLPNAVYAIFPIGLFILIFPNLDAYLINPHIYKKQMKLNPLLSVSAILLGQAYFGIVGVFISIPSILVITITYNFYKAEIKAKFKQFKESL